MVFTLLSRLAVNRNTIVILRQSNIGPKCLFSVSAPKSKDEDILLSSHKNNVTTLTMNQPKKLNGWTMEMMRKMKDSLEKLAKDPQTKVVVLTGKDPYYCAGVK